MIEFNKVTMNLSSIIFNKEKSKHEYKKKNYTHNLILVLSFLPFFDKKKWKMENQEKDCKLYSTLAIRKPLLCAYEQTIDIYSDR
jgi:hypothetical protein